MSQYLDLTPRDIVTAAREALASGHINARQYLKIVGRYSPITLEQACTKH